MWPMNLDPQKLNGQIWWNENNPAMRALWGTQKDYDEFVRLGGSWADYVNKVQERYFEFNKEKEREIVGSKKH
mgnify:CR=1 FL=1